MKTKSFVWGLALVLMTNTTWADPQLTSWLMTPSGRYARVYTNTASQNSGNAVTTWNNGNENQSAPAYAGVQEIDYSASWVYMRCTGLGFHVMGPWYLDLQKTQIFPNWPLNTHIFARIPRTPAILTSKTATGLGEIGVFVDGVAMYNSWDAYFWNGSSNSGAGSSSGYYWRRDAYVNEGPSFDPGNAHQDQSGTFHYHANPPGLRYMLGDNVSYNVASNSYSENTSNFHHSPILAWTFDGYPLYGPYGYSTATNSGSGIRRMISGYALRNGQNGTDNLNSTGRQYLPGWAARLFNTVSNLTGPTTSAYVLGTYMEDNAYLGDCGKTQGTDFDLDEYNGRYCVTPEFPNGTYAYFVSISTNGTPVYPYNMAGGFYGSPTGGAITNLTETVTTNFLGGPNRSATINSPVVNGTGTVTLTWNSVEGGTYKIASSTNLTDWNTTKTSGLIATSNITSATFATNGTSEFYVTDVTNLAAYDSVTNSSTGTGGSSGITSVSPTTYARGTSFVLTVNLSATGNPAPPPASAPIISVSIGTNAGTSLLHVSQTEVQATFNLAGTTGAQTVSVVFPGPPGNMTNYVTYTLVNGFTVQ